MSSHFQWIDAHCHLTDTRVFLDADRILKECRDQGIAQFLLGGISPEEWVRQIQLKKNNPEAIGLCFGAHPWWVDDVVSGKIAPLDQCDAEDVIEEALTELRRDTAQISAVGETGLDFARDRRKKSEEPQTWAFQEQLLIAKQASKPLVLHIVQAHEEALKILKAKGPFKARGLVHSFSGSWEQAQRYMDLGFLISVGARATYPEAQTLHHVIRECPKECLVLETDAPDQPPFHHHGELHSPLSLLKVAEICAQIRSEKAETLLSQCRQNLLGVFSWN